MSTESTTSSSSLESEPASPGRTVIPPINRKSGGGWFDWLPSWKPTSEEQLIKAEDLVLKNLQGQYKDHYVPVATDTYIRTLSMSPRQPNHTSLPLVMVHGFGCGLGAFYKNLDHLHSTRNLYAFDVLGFGRSSRTPFSTDPEEIETQYVESFENWRKAMGLERFILLGHSLGAYLCTAYAMKYPDRVRHLVLVDAWGFVEKPDESEVRRAGRYPLIIPVVQYYSSMFSPFTIIRALGPYGPRVFSRIRRDLHEKFGDDFVDYVYHCSAQDPTGETAFTYLQLPIAYSKRPILSRLYTLSPSVPISMLYGTRSWFDNSTGEKVYSMRPDSFVDIHYVKGAGHHIHAELPDIFNEVVNNICDMVDSNGDREGGRSEQCSFHSH